MSSARRNDSQVEAPPSPPGVDRLSKLPMELLQKIFDDAYATPKPTEPLSRTLLPLFDRCVWRDVKVVGDKRLAAFCITFQTRPSVGKHCRSLKFEQLKSPAVSPASLETVFANLPNLTKLVVHGDWEMFLDVLLPAGHQPVFSFSSTIRHFACLCKTQRADPYNPAYLASLASMTSLTVLELIFQHESPVKPSSAPSSGAPVTLPPLDVLSVSTSHGSTLDSLHLLLQGAPAVKKLVIKHYKDPASLAKLVSALTSPYHLEHLSLRARYGASGALPIELKQLNGLKTITLRGNFSHLGRDSFDILQTLPLERIEIGKNSDVSAVQLASLVKGTAKLSSLRELRLDNIEGVIGIALEAHGDVQDRGAECGWKLPRWTSAFSARNWQDDLCNGVLEDVKVTGSILMASDVEDAWDAAVEDFYEVYGPVDDEVWFLALERYDGDEELAQEAIDNGEFDWQP